jgi:hypothetical protein
MISLKKLIYSVPDALEILFEETGVNLHPKLTHLG